MAVLFEKVESMIRLADDKKTRKHRRDLEKSTQEIRTHLTDQTKTRSLPKELLDRLNAFLAKSARATVFLTVDNSRRTEKWWGCCGGYCIWIHPRCFEPYGRNRVSRLTSVLFHELVHAAGGWELDAEYYENHFFGEKEGATRPNRADLQQIIDDKYEGWWLYLDADRRRVMDLWKNDRGEFSQSANLQKFQEAVNIKSATEGARSRRADTLQKGR